MAIDGRTKEGRKLRAQEEMEIWNEYCRADADIIREATEKNGRVTRSLSEQFSIAVRHIDAQIERLNKERSELWKKYDAERDKAYHTYFAEAEALRAKAGWEQKAYDDVIAEARKKKKVK